MVVAADHEMDHALKNLMLLAGELNLFFDAPTCHDIMARCNKRGDDGSRNRKPTASDHCAVGGGRHFLVKF